METVLRITAPFEHQPGGDESAAFRRWMADGFCSWGLKKLRGKPISRKVEGYINMIGLLALFGLMILLTYQDIARLITGGA